MWNNLNREFALTPYTGSYIPVQFLTFALCYVKNIDFKLFFTSTLINIYPDIYMSLESV